jgi:hypothetical protein
VVEYLKAISSVKFDTILLNSINEHLSAISIATTPSQPTTSTPIDKLFDCGVSVAKQWAHARNVQTNLIASMSPRTIGNRSADGSTYSTTFITTMHDSWATMVKMYDELANIDLVEFCQAGMRSLVDIESLDVAAATYNVYLKNGSGPLASTVYIALIKTTLADHLDKSILKRVWHDLELLKTAVLTESAIAKTAISARIPAAESPNVVQMLVQRYNLSPDGTCRPWAKICAELGLNDTVAKVDIIKDLTILRKIATLVAPHGLCIINKCVHAGPIEHNLWTVLAPGGPSMQGVCEEKIVAARTIKLLDATLTALGLTKTGAPKNIIFEPTNAPTYYVLETLDGETWRFMLPWAVPQAGGDIVKYVPANWLPCDLTTYPSHRLTAYNAIINDEIMKHVEDRVKYAVTNLQESRMEGRVAEGHWMTVRAGLVRQIVAKYATKISSAIKDDATYSHILAIIAQEVAIPKMPADKDSAELALRELAITYYSDYAMLQNNLKTNALELYGNGPTRGANSAALEQFTHKLFTELLERFLSRRSNIYVELDKKLGLLAALLMRG